VRLLGLGLFCLGLPISYLSFVLPVFGKALGSTTSQIGLLYSGFFVMTMVVRPIIGVLTDRFGRKPFILLGLLGYAGALACLALAQSFLLLFAGRVLQGVASAFLWIVSDASVADVSETQERTRNFGIVTGSYARGQLIGAFVGYTILFTYLGFHKGAGQASGIRASFCVFSVVVLITTILLGLKLPETIRRKPTATAEVPPFRPKGPWKVLLAATFTSAAAMLMITPLVILLFQDRFKASVEIIALAYIPMGLVWGFAPRYVARLVDRFGKMAIMAASFAASALAAAVIPFAPALWIMAIIWAVAAVFDVGGNLAEQSLIADITHESHFGKSYSLYVFIHDLGAAIGPLIGTWLYSRSVYLPFIAAAVLYLASGIIVAVGGRRSLAETTESVSLLD